MLGTTIDGKYRIVRLLGQGGMGAVYEATHTGTGRRVALKVITGEIGLSQDAIARFQREARAAGVIESQHIVQVLDTGVDRELGVPFMVMEFLVGEDVQQLLERLGALPQDLALRIVGQTCTGLQKAHEAGVVHRDIKPANLFVAKRDDGDLVLRLLDFGIAKVKMDQMLGGGDQGFTRTGSMLGSPLYMSPEQAMGLKTVDHRTDIWSLGAVLYEVLSGRTPHFGKDTLGQLIMAICSAPPEPIQSVAPWIAPEVSQIVHRALRLDPAERYQSAAEMRDAIRALLPSGFMLMESMLMPLPAAERQYAAAAHIQTNPGPGPSAVIVPSAAIAPGATTGAGAVTADPSFSSTQAEKPRSNGKLFAGLGVAAIVAAAAGVWLRSQHAAEVSPAASASALASAPVADVLPSAAVSVNLPPSASSAPLSMPVSHTVRLQISPASAKVDVDGTPVKLAGGFLELQGVLGSVHSVHASVGARQTTQQVSVADSGAVPPRVDVPAAGSAPPAAVAAVAHTQHAEPAPKPVDPAPAPAPAPIHVAPAATPVKPKPTGPTLDKQFE